MKLTGPVSPVSPGGETAATAAPAQLIEDPITGEIVMPDDVDGLIGCYERLKEMAQQITFTRGQIARALAEKTEGNTRTRRIVGRERAAKIEMPGTSWDNAKLKEAYYAYPQYRDMYLRITEIAPDLRNVNKLRSTSGPADLETFKKLVLAAEREPAGSPYITIEK